MAYDDSRFRGEPDYGDDDDGTDAAFGGTSAYPPGSYAYAGGERGERTDGIARRGYGPSNLDDVFDDPAHGEPGRDRLGVHISWELVLLAAAAVVGYVLYTDHRSAVTGDGLRGLMLSATVLGLLILGTGLSLRAAAPNLAVGPIAVASSMFFADHADGGLLATALKAGLLALAVGTVMALMVVGLHVPAWAATFGAGLAVVVWIQQHHSILKLPAGAYQPLPQAVYWFGGFVALAVVGGVLGSVRPIRRAVGRFRPVSDPAHRRGGAAATVGVAALLGSSALAAVAGVLIALRAGQVQAADPSLTLTGLALGGALLAGTSAFGRRGGLLGAVLAAILLTVVIRYLEVTDRKVAQLAIAAVAIGVGLIVTRLVETFGRPLATAEREVDQWRTISPSSASATPSDPDNGWGNSRPTGWTSPLPASSADDRWEGDGTWGGR
jgi:ribose/xylose/arabinose/galactoside ABC-type transport system permease subunit